jgi:FKBP-type peptidyl-prolyl cis-trans isomerase
MTRTFSRFALTFVAALSLAIALGSRGQAQPTAPATAPAGEKTVSPEGLEIVKVVPGAGARDGDLVYVLYTGKLTNGTVFDASSLHGNEPIAVKLGGGQVIKGWELGLQGATVGEKRHLTIPPGLGYGSTARGDKIPANSTLIFDIEVVGILRGVQ